MTGQVTPAQVNFWRARAFQRLTELILAMQGDTNPNDGLIDGLVRSLSKLPERPADRVAYAGIFAVTNAVDGRKKAVERLRILAKDFNGDLGSVDALIDDLIRVLSNLPQRPLDKQPYASLFPASQMRWLTTKDLRAIAPTASSNRINQLIDELNRTMLEFDISTPLRQAHFLAQILHESDRLNALEEYASGAAYEWRSDLGNVNSGDGIRFKGRGLIQVTGRNNYRECSKALGVDLISNPKRLADPDLACRSAGWYWSTRKLNPDADRDDVRTITKVINGGFNGLDDRIQLLQAAKRVLGV